MCYACDAFQRLLQRYHFTPEPEVDPRDADLSGLFPVQVNIPADFEIDREALARLAELQDAPMSIGFSTDVPRAVVVARSYLDFRRYCEAHQMRHDRAVFLHTGDSTASQKLRGIRQIIIYRVDGAVTDAQTEGLLRALSERYGSQPPGNAGLVNWATQRMAQYQRPQDFRTLEDVTAAVEPEPGDGYVPHGEIHTRPIPETAWENPHHWPSTLERSPYWHRREQTLQVPAGDTVMIYTRDELDEDVRYI